MMGGSGMLGWPNMGLDIMELSLTGCGSVPYNKASAIRSLFVVGCTVGTGGICNFIITYKGCKTYSSPQTKVYTNLLFVSCVYMFSGCARLSVNLPVNKSMYNKRHSARTVRI